MNPTSVPPGEQGGVESIPIGARQRLTLGPDGLVLENRVRDGGTAPARSYPYASIQAVYVYEETHWGAVGAVAAAWGLYLMVIIPVALVTEAGWAVTLALAALGTVVAAGYLFHLRRKPRRMLRIERATESLVVEHRSEAFVAALAQRLAAGPPAVTPAPEGEEAGPPPG